MATRCDCGLGFDLDLATHIQQLLFPKNSPLCSWCCIGTKNRMVSGLGGDYFDFITMEDDCQAVFIGDVTGHGISASVVMSLLYGYIHRCTRGACDPADLVRQVNDFLQSFAVRSREFDHLFSSTLFFGIIDPKSLLLHYANAGHPAPLVRRRDKLFTLPATTQPVGFFDHPEIAVGTFSFERDDRLLLYTDGIIDTPDPQEQRFGLNRLQQVLLTHNDDHFDFLDELFAALRDFSGETPPVDDCTAIVIDFHGFRPGRRDSRLHVSGMD